MRKVIAFAGSNSSTSINKRLATYAASLLDKNEIEIEILDLNDYDLPMFGVDLEKKIGSPDNAGKFLEKIRTSDGVIVSLAEHNGAYSAVFKNLYDWMSRIEKNLWYDKPMLLMAASTGGRGGASVLEIAEGKFPRMGAKIVASYSFPSFNDNFKDGTIINNELEKKLRERVSEFENAIVNEYSSQ